MNKEKFKKTARVQQYESQQSTITFTELDTKVKAFITDYCVHHEDTVTMEGLLSGDVTITFKGKNTAEDCYRDILEKLPDAEVLTGLSLINIERAEQLSKHGRSLSDDVQRNALRQLEMGAQKLLHEDHNMALTRELPPAGWNIQVWQHMCDKPYKERLVIAGALIAAAIDRQLLIETQNTTSH